MTTRRLMSGIAFALLGILALTGCSRTASEDSSGAVVASDDHVSGYVSGSVSGNVSTDQEATGKVQEPVKNPQGRGMVYYSFFDTVSYVYSYAGDEDELFYARCDLVADILDEYHRLFDIYYEYSGINNLRTVNLNAGKEAVPVDRKLIDFLLYAREMYELTSGEMDVTMGAVLSLWHDARYSNPAFLPEQGVLEEAGRYCGFEYLEIDEQAGTVRLTDPRASIDAGALGKGYATEMAARALEELGVDHYVLNIGGNIRIIGTKVDGTGWTTGIRDPKDPDNSFVLKVVVSDCSLVTSGSYERYFTVDGVRYSHIIDKDTLMPASFFESLSVVTRDSGLADALSTALFCMSYEEGLELVSRLEDVECLWVFSDGSYAYTPGLGKLIVM